jgi:2-polyprenyl-3-methyl-5-hydroxy-6-metoxy-1,4-benzoquinol methylase
MPKKILFHSAVHHFVSAAKLCRANETQFKDEWSRFVDTLSFSHIGNGELEVRHAHPNAGAIRFSAKDACLYQRGDNEDFCAAQEPMIFGESDPVLERNAGFFKSLVLKTADQAGVPRSRLMDVNEARLQSEAEFHDVWATSARNEDVDVRRANEACTAPEMRFITQQLGDLRGKRLLDVGCGLGEASVYFALQGADVTASDLSAGMLEHTRQLAVANDVRLATILSSSESLQLADTAKFDIIYIGNTLHHVDIAQTMKQLTAHLADDGVFVSWDPVAYNPLINLYRRIAVDVRTEDEHPLTLRDIREVSSHFQKTETRYFWLLTLSIFLLMVLQRRNPNRERFWKKVIEEEERWAWLYRPLERLDRHLLRWLPFLRPLCWNVVIIGRNPRRS